MNKVILLLIVMGLLLAGVGLSGCGPKAAGTTGTTAPSLGGSALADVPIYPGMRQVQKATQSFPVTAGYGKADVRAYESNDSAEKIAAFYKAQMPAKGWVESQWLDTPQFKNGAYSRNSQADIAVIWIVSAEGKTEVVLMRASKE